MTYTHEIENIKINIARDINSVSEEDLRQAVNNYITGHVYSLFNERIYFNNEVKADIEVENKLYGFIDSIYGGLIIEYKRPNKIISDLDRTQLLEYLYTFDQKENATGVLTNGLDLEIYEYNYDEKLFQINKTYSGDFNEFQIDYISNIIGNKDKLIINENNINEIFGVNSNKRLFRKFFNILLESKNKRTNLLFREWQRLFNLSDTYDKFDPEKKKNIYTYYEELLDYKIEDTVTEYKALFSIQTYYAVIMKLLTYKIITELKNIQFKKDRFIKDFFKKLEDNILFRDHGIINLVDEDFFSWYLDEFSEIELKELYDKIKDITSIQTEKINLTFIKFYESIFPASVRHSMGEYYTPSYLANDVIIKQLNTQREKIHF